MSLVSRTLGESPGSKIIIFTQYRDTCDLIEQKVSRIDGSRVCKLVGQAKGGLKQKEQVDLLNRFREGEFNILVATQVGEEGLDITGADAVVFYEPIPSEIRTIQRRGRTGRKNDGEVYILIARGTADEVFDKVSKDREELMRKKLETLSLKLSQGRSGLPDRSQRRLDTF
jgi:Fanconi anemia group M protein